MPYAFAHFIDPQPTRNALEYYRSHFTPSAQLAEPRAIIALGALCAETDAAAQYHFASTRLQRRRIRRGDRRPIAPADEALKELGSEPDPLTSEHSEWPRYAVGTPEKVAGQLATMAHELGADEVMLVTVVHSHQARMNSYRLLAQAAGLSPRR